MSNHFETFHGCFSLAKKNGLRLFRVCFECIESVLKNFTFFPRGPSVLEKRHPNWKDDVSAISTTNQEKVDDLQKS